MSSFSDYRINFGVQALWVSAVISISLSFIKSENASDCSSFEDSSLL